MGWRVEQRPSVSRSCLAPETGLQPGACRAWVDDAIDNVARDAATASLRAMLPDLARRLSEGPDDLATCALMQAVAHAQAIHVTEVR